MTMFNEAAETIEREIVRFEGLAKVVAAFRAAGSLEQVAHEIEQRVAFAKTEEAHWNERVEHNQAKAREIVANAKAEAEAIKARADEAVAIMAEQVKKAEAKAANIVAQAEYIAAATMTGADSHAVKVKADAQAELDAIAPAIATGKVELDLLTTKIEAAQTRLDIITAQIAELRAKF